MLPSQSKYPPLTVRRNISLFHLLFGLLIFLAILPAGVCMQSPSFVEPKVGWLARTLSSVVAVVAGASIAGQPSAVEPSTNVETTDNSIPPSLADNSSNSSTNHPTPRKLKRRRRGYRHRMALSFSTWHALCCCHGVAHRLLGIAWLTGCRHDSEVVAMAWLMHLPWRGV